MHTGDLAEMREDGYCNIVGRIKDMVIRGGENIYPREIEEFLYQHPDVEDVQVIGVPDEKYGEELCAWIKLRAGAEPLDADAVREFCARPAQPLQDPALRDDRRGVPDDGHRQDPQGRDARGVRRRSSASAEAQAPLRSVRHPEAFASRSTRTLMTHAHLSPRPRALLDRIDAWSGHSRVRKVLVRAG